VVCTQFLLVPGVLVRRSTFAIVIIGSFDLHAKKKLFATRLL
jgi:hypothetical protein